MSANFKDEMAQLSAALAAQAKPASPGFDSNVVAIPRASAVPSTASAAPTGAPLLLDTPLIRDSEHFTRLPEGWQKKAFEKFVEDVKATKGNLQPIMVRPVRRPGKTQYEVVYGHRRLRACATLGLQVLAVVVAVDAVESLLRLSAENGTLGLKLTPYEQGMQYQKALTAGLFLSARRLGDALRADHSRVSKCLLLARLPEEVLNAFRDRGKINMNWAHRLAKAVTDDGEEMLIRAKVVKDLPNAWPAKQVFEHLVGRLARPSDVVPPRMEEILRQDEPWATVEFPPQGRHGNVVVRFRGVHAVDESALMDALRSLAAGTLSGLPLLAA